VINPTPVGPLVFRIDESSWRRSSIGQNQCDSSRPAADAEPATLPLRAAMRGPANAPPWQGCTLAARGPATRAGLSARPSMGFARQGPLSLATQCHSADLARPFERTTKTQRSPRRKCTKNQQKIIKCDPSFPHMIFFLLGLFSSLCALCLCGSLLPSGRTFHFECGVPPAPIKQSPELSKSPPTVRPSLKMVRFPELVVELLLALLDQR
jgi:hypothetical protein